MRCFLPRLLATAELTYMKSIHAPFSFPNFFLGNKEVNTYMIMSEKNSIINGSFMRNTGFFVNHPDPKMFKATHILSNNYNMKELHKDDLMYFHYKGNNRYKSYMWHFHLPASLQANDCILYIDA